MLFFIVQEWEAVEPDHPVCDAAFAESVADGFCYPDDNLYRPSSASLDGFGWRTNHGGEDVG